MDVVTLGLAKNYTNTKTGDLSTLTTTEKTNIVGSVNELNSIKAEKAQSPTEGHIATLDTDGNPVDGGTALSSINSQLIDKANSTAIAPAYNPTSTYALGAICTYLGARYKCTTAITVAEAWTAGHWTAEDVQTVLDDHTSQLAEKANKATSPTLGHIALLDAGGNPSDSGMFIGANNNAWYAGRNLKTLYGDAATFMAALRTGAPFDIRIGDYWPITLSGTFRDVGSYTAPIGITYYSDTGLTSSVGTTELAYEATYVDATYCSISVSGTTCYVSTAACLTYFVRTLSNAVVNLEVAGINLYYNHGDTALAVPHILFCPRDCLPFYIKMRKTNAIWHNEATTNPWLGSAMYATLNDATYGLLPLIAATDIGAYIFGGPNGAGMRTLLPDMATGVGTPTGWAGRDRGKLFLPMEKEVWGNAIWATNANHQALSVQWPIFFGSLRHIVKGAGNAGSRTGWWCATATGATSFAAVGSNGYPSNSGAAGAFGVAPCFLIS